MDNLYGVVVITQPVANSVADVLRTVPVAGLVGNEVYVTCIHGENLQLYELGEDDIVSFCASQGEPYLGSIPHVLPGSGPPSLNGVGDHILAQMLVVLERQQASSVPYKIMLALAKSFEVQRGKLVPSTNVDNARTMIVFETVDAFVRVFQELLDGQTSAFARDLSIFNRLLAGVGRILKSYNVKLGG